MDGWGEWVFQAIEQMLDETWRQHLGWAAQAIKSENPLNLARVDALGTHLSMSGSIVAENHELLFFVHDALKGNPNSKNNSISMPSFF
jgi:hypothetical protein